MLRRQQTVGSFRRRQSSASISLAKTVLTYVNDGGGSPQVQSVTSYDDNNGSPVKVDFDYDSYGNITNKREYGYQISGAWQVRRRTHLDLFTDTAYTRLSHVFARLVRWSRCSTRSRIPMTPMTL